MVKRVQQKCLIGQFLWNQKPFASTFLLLLLLFSFVIYLSLLLLFLLIKPHHTWEGALEPIESTISCPDLQNYLIRKNMTKVCPTYWSSSSSSSTSSSSPLVIIVIIVIMVLTLEDCERRDGGWGSLPSPPGCQHQASNNFFISFYFMNSFLSKFNS